jgi:glycosyltransferase involved in cell wall biosynthesis
MKSSAADFRFGLETPHPFQPAPGYFRLNGWALNLRAGAPTRARLKIGDQIFSPTNLRQRLDVAAEFPVDPYALESGFEFLCYLKTGLYLGALEASADGCEWTPLKTLAVPVSSHPLLGAIEKPAAKTFVDSPQRIEGWCFHPEYIVTEVTLQFGNLEVACDYGLERRDVAERFSEHSAAAAQSGFITAENLPRGRGQMRVRARTQCGRIYFLESTLSGDIRTGANPAAAPLSSIQPLPPLPRLVMETKERGAPRSIPSIGARNILFALYGDFTCNSALHVAALANELIAQGYDCVVAGPSHKETIGTLPEARFMAAEFSELDDISRYFRDGCAPAIVHAWTPREVVRTFAEAIARRYGSAIFVHLEDNEQELLSKELGRPLAELLSMEPAAMDRLVPEYLSHPIRAAEFLKSAAGVTSIVERLRETVPSEIPSMTFWPAAAEAIFTPQAPDSRMRAALGIPDTATILFYHGNVHAANVDEVKELYLAVAQLNNAGHETYLIRTGRDDPGLMESQNLSLGAQLIHLGYVSQTRFLPQLMGLADYFVQPGIPGPFNDYRFPSKLPEFFAIGRPVILPKSNLGVFLQHGQDAYVLEKADAESIASAIVRLNGDPASVQRLSGGALAFAEKSFSWPRSARTLQQFYTEHSRLPIPGQGTVTDFTEGKHGIQGRVTEVTEL